MASLGSLFVDLALNIAGFTDPLTKAGHQAEAFEKKLNQTFRSVAEGALVMAGAFVSVQAVFQTFGAATKAAAELENLQTITGDTVEALGDLVFAGKLYGLQAEEMLKLTKELDKSLVEASNPMSKTAELFKLMGVNAKALESMNFNERLAALAETFNKMPDGPTKTALALELFGKAGQKAIGMMRELADNTALTNTVNERFGRTTQEQIEAAEKLEKQLIVLRESGIRAMQPAIAGVATALESLNIALGAFGNSGKSATSAGQLIELGAKHISIAIIEVEYWINKVIVRIESLAKVADAFKTGGGVVKTLENIARAAVEADIKLALLNSDRLKALADVADAGKPIVKKVDPDADIKGAAASVGQMAAIQDVLNGKMKEGADAAKKEAAEIAKLAEKWNDILIASASGWDSKTVKAVAELDANWKKAGLTAAQYAQIRQSIIEQDPKLNAAWAAENKLLAEQEDAQQANVIAAQKMADALKDATVETLRQADAVGKDAYAVIALQAEYKKTAIDALPGLTEAGRAYMKGLVDSEAAARKLLQAQRDMAAERNARNALNDEVALLGKVGVEREKLANQLRLQHELDVATTEDAKKHARAMAEIEDATIDARQAQEQYTTSLAAFQDMLKTADEYGRSFFESLGEGMKGLSDWAKRVGADLKKWLLNTLYEMTVRKWVVNAVASVSATGAGAAGAAGYPGGAGAMTLGGPAAGGAGGGMDYASMLSGVAGSGSTIGAIGLGATNMLGLSGGAAAFTAAYGSSMAAATATLGIAAEAGAVAVGGTAAVLGAMATMIPVIGAIIAVAYLAYTMLSQAQGGAKEGGFATTGIRAEDVPGGRYFTPDHADSEIAKLTDGITQSFESAFAGLGGKGDQRLGFALGYDTDPQGTAQSRVSVGVYRDGAQVFKQADTPAGRDDETLQAAITTAGKRALLAALQVSDLPSDISSILNTLEAATATDSAIENVVNLANSFRGLRDSIDGLADPMAAATKGIEVAGRTQMEAWNAQRDAVMDLAASTPGTVEGMNALAAASDGLYQSTVTLLVGILQAKTALSGMFGDTKEKIKTSLMSPEELYKYYESGTDKLYADLAKASDPAEISRISQKINDNVNKMWDLFTQSPEFANMTPAERTAAQNDFLTNLDKVNDLTGKRLDAAAKVITDGAAADRLELKTRLDEILDKVKQTGVDFNHGAETISSAASRGVNVHVTVDDRRTYTEVNGGTYGGDYGGGSG